MMLFPLLSIQVILCTYVYVSFFLCLCRSAREPTRPVLVPPPTTTPPTSKCLYMCPSDPSCPHRVLAEERPWTERRFSQCTGGWQQLGSQQQYPFGDQVSEQQSLILSHVTAHNDHYKQLHSRSFNLGHSLRINEKKEKIYLYQLVPPCLESQSQLCNSQKRQRTRDFLICDSHVLSASNPGWWVGGMYFQSWSRHLMDAEI